MMAINNCWNRLEELKVPFELRVATIRLYEKFIAKFRNNKGWPEEINYNIGVKRGCPLYSTLFVIYIDKLESCLEEASYVGTTLVGIIIILILYTNDTVLMGRCHFDLNK